MNHNDGGQLADLVDGIPTAMLTTEGPNGLLGRPLTVQRIDRDGAVWFLIDRNASWVDERAMASANLAWVGDRTWVSAAGTARLVPDPELIDDLGDPVSGVFFEDDAEPIALRVDVRRAEYWDAPGKLRQLFNIGAAAITGGTPDMGERGALTP